MGDKETLFRFVLSRFFVFGFFCLDFFLSGFFCQDFLCLDLLVGIFSGRNAHKKQSGRDSPARRQKSDPPRPPPNPPLRAGEGLLRAATEHHHAQGTGRSAQPVFASALRAAFELSIPAATLALRASTTPSTLR